MNGRGATLLATAVLAGCGVPSEPTKQAEEVGSVAAEGAILAHDAAEGARLRRSRASTRGRCATA